MLTPLDLDPDPNEKLGVRINMDIWIRIHMKTYSDRKDWLLCGSASIIIRIRILVPTFLHLDAGVFFCYFTFFNKFKY